MDFCSLSRSKIFLSRNFFHSLYTRIAHSRHVIPVHMTLTPWPKYMCTTRVRGCENLAPLYYPFQIFYTRKCLRTLHFRMVFFLRASRRINRKTLEKKKNNNKRNIYSRRLFTFILKQRCSFYRLFIFHRLRFLR